MTTPDPDRSCIDRVLAGEMRALEELYERHNGIVYGVVSRVLGRAEDAEEVVQEVWLEVWNRAERYDGSRGAVIAWVLTIARSRAIDRVRSRTSRSRREETAGADVMAPAGPEPGATAAQSQLRERVNAALGTLTSNQRQVLELAYFGGLSQSEVAARLGAPLGTVKSWARQGLLALRELLPEEEWV